MNIGNVKIEGGKGVYRVLCRDCGGAYYLHGGVTEEALTDMGFINGACPRCIARRKEWEKEREREEEQKQLAAEEKKRKEEQKFSNRLKKAIRILLGKDS